MDKLYNEEEKEPDIDPNTNKPKRLVIAEEVDKSAAFPIGVKRETMVKGATKKVEKVRTFDGAQVFTRDMWELAK